MIDLAQDPEQSSPTSTESKTMVVVGSYSKATYILVSPLPSGLSLLCCTRLAATWLSPATFTSSLSPAVLCDANGPFLCLLVAGYSLAR